MLERLPIARGGRPVQPHPCEIPSTGARAIRGRGAHQPEMGAEAGFFHIGADGIGPGGRGGIGAVGRGGKCPCGPPGPGCGRLLNSTAWQAHRQTHRLCLCPVSLDRRKSKGQTTDSSSVSPCSKGLREAAAPRPPSHFEWDAPCSLLPSVPPSSAAAYLPAAGPTFHLDLGQPARSALPGSEGHVQGLAHRHSPD